MGHGRVEVALGKFEFGVCGAGRSSCVDLPGQIGKDESYHVNIIEG